MFNKRYCYFRKVNTRPIQFSSIHFFQLIFKRSKLSESLTPQGSGEIYEENCIPNLIEDGNDTSVEKKLRDLPKDDTEFKETN